MTHEPVRGDIYVSVPETFAAARISFFATTKAGYVYKFSCSIDKIEAAQVPATSGRSRSRSANACWAWQVTGSPRRTARSS